MFTDVPIVRARTTDAFGSSRSRSSMRYVVAVPAASPTDTPVITRPTSNPGRAFQTAITAAAAIIVATPPSIAPRRPIRATTTRSQSKATIAPHAKTA